MDELRLRTCRVTCGSGQCTAWAEFKVSKTEGLVAMTMHVAYGGFAEAIGDAGVLFPTVLHDVRAAVDKLIADSVFALIVDMEYNGTVFTAAEAAIAVGKAVDNQLLLTLEEQVRTLAAIANLEGEEHEKRGA